ncbi:MAG: type II toxin-antitoxin system HicB family antitoxin [Alphaproteobacteria bacterium]|nr:type II toxin-antitoxin system HicB family antitoxin [Alphaproteobacteria bacterium]
MLAYPAIFTSEPEGGFTVTFRDVPEAITWGGTDEEATSMAVDALETALSIYVDDRRDLPRPSAARRRERQVPLSALGMAKASLYATMRQQKVGKAALARRLHCHLPQIDRLLDFCHASKLAQIEKALASLGKRLIVDIRNAA